MLERKPKKLGINVGASIPPDVHEALLQLAERDRAAVSSIIRTAIVRHVEREMATTR